MRQLQVLNAVVLAAGVAMGVVLAAVCVIYSFYVGSVPRLQAEFRTILVLTAGFWILAGTAAAAWFGHRRRWPWRWIAQPLPLLPLAGIVAFFAAGP